MADSTSYNWTEDKMVPSHAYLTPAVRGWLGDLAPQRVLDFGCGDGRLTAELSREGYQIEGLDSSRTGIEIAQKRYPAVPFHVHDVGQPLGANLGAFDVVIAVEVIEHLFLPRQLFARAGEALGPRGRLLITTPYHGYIKNIALAMTNNFDSHVSVGWDYGHIKFFSRKSLVSLAEECGFTLERFSRVGRIPPVAASMAAQFIRQD